MIHFLHPVFTILTIILVIYSFLEVNNYKNYSSVWVVIAFLTIFIGLRYWIGADYANYFKAYDEFGRNLDMSDILNMISSLQMQYMRQAFLFMFLLFY